MMKRKDAENFENMLKTVNMAKDALRNGLGPAHNSNNMFVAIPGIIEYDTYFATDVYYAVVVEKSENGSKPVDWYSWAPSNSKHGFISGFGGWYKYGYDEFIKANSWVKEEWDSLDKEIKAVFEKKICHN